MALAQRWQCSPLPSRAAPCSHRAVGHAFWREQSGRSLSAHTEAGRGGPHDTRKSWTALFVAAAAGTAGRRGTRRSRRQGATAAAVAGTAVASETAEAKRRLMGLCQEVAASNGTSASPAQRERIAEALAALEGQAAAVERPATEDAAALDGVWTLMYTTSSGPSAGLVGPFLGEVTQDIDIPSGEYINFVSFGDGALRLALRATWKPLSDKDWRVVFLDIGPELFGSKLFAVDFPPDRGGTWAMSYTDEDLRIVWTETSGGVTTRDGTRNVFVLARQPK